MDYKACLYWLESYDNGVKTDPIYESAVKENGKIKVTQNGKQGLLNCDFSTLLPAKYDAIKSLYCVNKLFWVCTKKGKAALFDEEGNALTKHLYDAINLNYSQTTYDVHNNQFNPRFEEKIPPYFQVEIDDKKGLIDDKGEIIDQIIYDKIKLDEYSNSSYSYNYGKSTYTWQRQAGLIFQLLNLNREVLYEDSNYTAKYLPNFLSKEVPILDILCEQPKNSHILFNVFSKESIGPFYNPDFRNGIISATIKLNEGGQVFYNRLMVHLYTSTEKIRFERLKTPVALYFTRVKNLTKVIDNRGAVIIQGNYPEVKINKFENEVYLWASKRSSMIGEDGNYHFEYDVYNQKGESTNSCNFSYSRKYFHSNTLDNFFESNDSEYSYVFSVAKKRNTALLFGEHAEKWGAFNGRGDIIIPFIYDEFQGKLPQTQSASLQGLHILKKGEKYGMLDNKGDLIYPFEYDYVHYNWNRTKLNYFGKNGKGTLIRSDKSVFIDEIDTLFMEYAVTLHHAYLDKIKVIKEPNSYRSYGSNYSNEKKPFFAVKSDSLYYCSNDYFKLYDTSVVKFSKSTMGIGGYILKPSGALVNISRDRTLMHLPHFYITVEDSTAFLYSTEGKQLAIINNYEIAGISGDNLLVKTKSKKVGLRTIDGKKWLLKPDYLEIIPSKVSNQFWVKTADSAGFPMRGEWKLVNQKGKNLFGKTTFNYPALPSTNSGSVTAVVFIGDKQGLMNTSNEIILNPVYQNITKSSNPNEYFVQKDSMWAVYHIAGILSPFYNDIADAKSLPIYKGITYTATDTLIEIFSYETGQWKIIAASAIEDSILQFADLATPLDEILPLTDEQRKSNATLWKSISHSKKYIKTLTPINNYYFLRDFNSPISNTQYFSSIQLRYSTFPNSHNTRLQVLEPTKFYNIERWNKKNKNYVKDVCMPIERRKLIYTDKGYYSEYLETLYAEDSKRKLNNFHLSDPDKKISFYDLFENQGKIDSFLYDYIEDHVNLHQLYGSTCLDFPKVYGRYTEHFSFANGGLYVHQSAYPNKGKEAVFLPYELLSPYMKQEFLELLGR